MSPNSTTTSLPSSYGTSGGSITTSSGAEHRLSEIPPSPPRLALTSLATKSSTTGACLSTSPTVLIGLINTWLRDKDALYLSLTNHHLLQEVQGFYKKTLRPAEGQLLASHIARRRNTVNILPTCIPMGEQGECLFQTCRAMKATGLSEDQYRSEVIALLKAQLSKTTDPDQYKDLTIGAGLGLGGSFMSAENRNALVAGILSMHASSIGEQMGAMILGACKAYGPNMTRLSHQLATLEKVVTSGATSTPEQLGAMMGNLCRFLGGERMAPTNRRVILERILTSHATCNLIQLRYMIHHLCLALGGNKMTADHRDGLLEQFLAQYKVDTSLHIPAMMKGLCMGLGSKEMTRANLAAVLAWILGAAETITSAKLICAIEIVCAELGHENMSLQHRDFVLDKILASYQTSTATQMGALITGMCFALNGVDPALSKMTPDNVNALICQVLKSHGTSSALQMGTMIRSVVSGLRGTNMTVGQRAVLAARIRESGRVQEIISALKLVHKGQTVVDFLQLEIGGV